MVRSQRRLVGECTSMCARRAQLRIALGERNKFEFAPDGTPLWDQMVKPYVRSSADTNPVPSEVRTQAAIEASMAHLVANVMPRFGAEPGLLFVEYYAYLRDRLREVYHDIHIQNLVNETTVSILEVIVRFYIQCNHRLPDTELKQNLDFVTKICTTLKDNYARLMARGIPCPNAAEMLAYRTILDPQPAFVLMSVPVELTDSPWIVFARKVVSAIKTANYNQFYALMNGAPYLLCCIMGTHFKDMCTKTVNIFAAQKERRESDKPVAVNWDKFRSVWRIPERQAQRIVAAMGFRKSAAPTVDLLPFTGTYQMPEDFWI
jgi:hypothetical protein